MLQHIDPQTVLFLDIETVPLVPSFAELPERLQPLWRKKAATKFGMDDPTEAEAAYATHAGLFAEFGKVVCVAVGCLQDYQGKEQFFVKTFAGDDEKPLLSGLAAFLQEVSTREDQGAGGRRRLSMLCAHNGREFDYPYLARRMLLNAISLPDFLNIAGKKPWQVAETLLDTMELWKFGDFKAYTSLELLAASFGIPSPKADISGADVASVYYQQQDLPRIVRYCARDVVSLCRLFQRYKLLPMVPDELVQGLPD